MMQSLATPEKATLRPELSILAGAPIAKQRSEQDKTKTLNSQDQPTNSELSADDRIDRGLIDQIASNRDSTAMKTFYERYRSRLVPFLYRLTRDDQLIEDVYNEVMLKLWDNAYQYRGQSKVSTWVFTIAYRSCLRMVKRQTKFQSFFDTQQELDDLKTEQPDDHYAEQQAIRTAVAKLSAKHRMVIELCYFQGYALEEIGQIINCPLNTVKTRLHHARKKIRATLEKQHQTSDWSNWL